MRSREVVPDLNSLLQKSTTPRVVALTACAATMLAIVPAHTETISAALARAYMTNPNLNQQRAATRGADEAVAQADAGYRPILLGTSTVGAQYSRGNQVGVLLNGVTLPHAAGVTISENIFNGNRTTNSVRHAEAQVMQSREQTREREQDTLQNAATAYMNVLRDTAVLALNKNNILVLKEQVRQTRVRLDAGTVTPTDVAQSEASLATAQANYFVAMAGLQTSIAVYRQVIGIEPKRLEAARPIDALLPASLPSAIGVGLSEHPRIQAALHNVDVAKAQVELNEGNLYPTLDVVAGAQGNYKQLGFPTFSIFNSSIVGQLNIPIYDGGQDYASVRRAKELLAQVRLQADLVRDQIRAGVVATWGQLAAAKAVIESSRAEVKASEVALHDVREQAEVGQRTTFDVLMAQQTLLQGRVRLVSAQRDRVVASYALYAAIGRLSAANLALKVVQYDPTVHFEQVKDKWIGLRTPDGR